MSEYRIFETDQFQSDLESRLGSHRGKIIAKLRNDAYAELCRRPHVGRNIKKLRGFSPETWRYRIGMYRFFYEIDDSRKVVFMIAADTRQSAY
ncbi:MAG: type II toxin-antitoxin system RelE/ParE family toxin [Candidatus Aminicenantes bacterium]|nr:type II toxin-antitoxin system RelE/ParE family toxin [Candidatus Aminicenantes bacterium]